MEIREGILYGRWSTDYDNLSCVMECTSVKHLHDFILEFRRLVNIAEKDVWNLCNQNFKRVSYISTLVESSFDLQSSRPDVCLHISKLSLLPGSGDSFLNCYSQDRIKLQLCREQVGFSAGRILATITNALSIAINALYPGPCAGRAILPGQLGKQWSIRPISKTLLEATISEQVLRDRCLRQNVLQPGPPSG